eukprot:TRINITY_DN1694_c0_g1_i3.p2 TRINITY_DN1694_c0_g1~~TRINITY_DN1694_c0_g1_i3.p2  ORF type:complete len:182 (+),score=7.44 TRINITY_DN1694_c0_g1_i3:208-753(+)
MNVYKPSKGTDAANLAEIPEGDEVFDVNAPQLSGEVDRLDPEKLDGATPWKEPAIDDDGDRARVGDLYVAVGLHVQPPDTRVGDLYLVVGLLVQPLVGEIRIAAGPSPSFPSRSHGVPDLPLRASSNTRVIPTESKASSGSSHTPKRGTWPRRPLPRLPEIPVDEASLLACGILPWGRSAT